MRAVVQRVSSASVTAACGKPMSRCPHNPAASSGAIASRFADPGVTAVYRELLRQVEAKGFRKFIAFCQFRISYRASGGGMGNLAVADKRGNFSQGNT